MTVSIEIIGVSHEYQHHAGKALDDVSLTVKPGEFVTLLGPSGSGKTTLLKLIAGLAEPQHGIIRLGGRDVTHVPIDKRNIGLVFQHYALFPHLTAYGNVAFPLKLRRVARSEIRRRTNEALELVGLAPEAKAYPRELSGGQQQRVAMARALVFNPDVLLLDEPLGALDRRLRDRLSTELRRLQREIGVTTVYVTHDQYEALVLSNRIAVMKQGHIDQVDVPEEVYRRPANRFVAEFMGDINIFECEVENVNDHHLELASRDGLALIAERLDTRSGARTTIPGTAVRCAVRPESFTLSTERAEVVNSWCGRISSILFYGSASRTMVETEAGRVIFAETHTKYGSMKEGSSVWVTVPPEDVIVL